MCNIKTEEPNVENKKIKKKKKKNEGTMEAVGAETNLYLLVILRKIKKLMEKFIIRILIDIFTIGV